VEHNCLKCETSINVCTECRSGWWLIDGCCTECYDGFSKHTLNSVETCVRCLDINCKACGSNGVCSECKPSYYLKSDNSCSLCTDTNFAKTVSSSNIALCTSCSISGCSECILNIAANTFTCADCDGSNFVQYSTKTFCIACTTTDTQTQIGNYCYESNDCTTNCKKCATATTCSICASNYYLTSSNQCLPCSSNCVTCSANVGSCTKCVNTHYIFGGVCVSTCSDGFYKSAGKCKAY
jgi:hypothetical protein